ncbi:MAG: PaaI family thioesterase [Betaproteobacteria bacterium]|nr:PaaI family thioesterase [Betaproteobacteria bacterium]
MTDLASIQQLLTPLFPGLMGVTLLEATPDRLVASLKVRSDLCTVGGILHGGALMAFADCLGGLATHLNLPETSRTVTIDSSTKFIGGSPMGSTVIGVCTPFHRGRTTMVWQTVIKTEAGKMCGVVTQTQIVLPAGGSAGASSTLVGG